MREAKRSARRRWSIDELSEETGITVRSIRNYQHKGLLMAPEVVGRVGYYSVQHVERLQSISAMIANDYSLASIAKLVDALDRGITLRQLVTAGGDPNAV